MTGRSGRPPVRLVHLGLGAFFRSHQAWYTARLPDADAWGYAAFAGRRPDLADALAARHGRYHLLTRGPDGDRVEPIDSLTAVHRADAADAWAAAVADPAVRAVTITVTEAGYHRRPDGRLDVDHPAIAADLVALRSHPAETVGAATAPGRLLAGLAARRRADGGPISVVPCDNLAGNAIAVRGVLLDGAAAVDPSLAAWIERSVTVIGTVVDRITPATTAADVATVARLTGVDDPVPVVTEPFAEWILSGPVDGGPDWTAAGAVVTADLGPFEDRKLWLLNGAHSLLAYRGSARGHATVAEAMADPVCAAAVTAWWDAAAPHLGAGAGDLPRYRAALVERFANPRLPHRLAQIAADGSQKLPVRVLPVVRAERAAGRLPHGAVAVLGAWVAHLRGAGAPVVDADAAGFVAAASGPGSAAVRAVLARLDAPLADDGELVAAVADAATAVAADGGTGSA